MAAFGWVCLGAFALVFVVLPGGLWLADMASAAGAGKLHRWLDERRKELAVRWLSRQGYQVSPMRTSPVRLTGDAVLLEIHDPSFETLMEVLNNGQ